MNHKKIYDQIIERARNRKIEGYCERHHIIPKALGGLDNSENIILLTAREHFVCHLLLAKMYGKGMWQAANLMANDGNHGKNTGRLYERLKIEAAKYHSTKMKGRKFTPEHIMNIKISHKDQTPSLEARKKISEHHKGKQYALGFKHTSEFKKKVSEQMKGNKYGLGRKQPESQKQARSIFMKSNKNPNRVKKFNKDIYIFMIAY